MLLCQSFLAKAHNSISSRVCSHIHIQAHIVEQQIVSAVRMAYLMSMGVPEKFLALLPECENNHTCAQTMQ